MGMCDSGEELCQGNETESELKEVREGENGKKEPDVRIGMEMKKWELELAHQSYLSAKSLLCKTVRHVIESSILMEFC